MRRIVVTGASCLKLPDPRTRTASSWLGMTAHKDFTEALQAATGTLATALGVEASDAGAMSSALES